MLLASFDRLLLARGYAGISVRELTRLADIGRSTFYEHFEGKDDLLEQSVSGPLAVLAAASTTGTPSAALQDVLSHIRGQRALARALLQGSARPILIGVLARMLEQHLTALARRSAAPPIAPPAFLSASLAYAQLGVIDAWLSDCDRYDVQTAARVLHATTQAGVSAMLPKTQL